MELNLLPWRETFRLKKKQSFKHRFGMMSLVVFLVIFYLISIENNHINIKKDINQKIKEDIRNFQEVLRLKKENILFKNRLIKKKNELEKVKIRMEQFANIFEGILPCLPTDMYLTRMIARSESMMMEGYAVKPSSLAIFTTTMSRKYRVKLISSENFSSQKRSSSASSIRDIKKNFPPNDGFKLHLTINEPDLSKRIS